MAQTISLKLPDAVFAYLTRNGDPEEQVTTLVTQDMLMANARNLMGIDTVRRGRKSKEAGGEE